MALSSLLDIVTQACDEMSLNHPTAVVGSSDTQVRQIYALANKSGRELMRAYQWGNLQKSTTFTTVNGTSDYPVPADFDRLIQSTEWDKTNHWRTMGPDTPQVARWRLDSNLAQASVRRSIRLIGNQAIRVFPTPGSNTSGNIIEYEYISNYWVKSAGNVAQSQFLSDGDTSLYDPELMVMAIKFRFMSAKGFDASAYFAEYNNRLKTCIAADIGGPTLSVNEKLTEQFLNFQNIPEAGYGS